MVCVLPLDDPASHQPLGMLSQVPQLLQLATLLCFAGDSFFFYSPWLFFSEVFCGGSVQIPILGTSRPLMRWEAKQCCSGEDNYWDTWFNFEERERPKPPFWDLQLLLWCFQLWIFQPGSALGMFLELCKTNKWCELLTKWTLDTSSIYLWCKSLKCSL